MIQYRHFLLGKSTKHLKRKKSNMQSLLENRREHFPVYFMRPTITLTSNPDTDVISKLQTHTLKSTDTKILTKC